jgi:MtaA/CmuA family methyltransferase
MTPRQILLNILDGRAAARAAVLCPGGMMSMAVAEVMATSGAGWPAAHSSVADMLRLALAMQEATGFDGVAMPFCMTVEAEAFGAEIDLGSGTSQPRVRGTILADDGSGDLRQPDWRAGRAAIVLEAMAAARAERPDVAILGNLVGPFSLLGSLADALQVLRWTRKSPETVDRHMSHLTSRLLEFGRLQIAAGAEVVCIADPTATGEILGGPRFRACVLPHLARLVQGLKDSGARVIVHICGRVEAIDAELRELPAHAVSFDSVADILAIHQSRPPWRVMGNVSPFLLEKGPPEAVWRRSRQLIAGGVQLVAPACGVIPTTPVEHLRAMRSAANI